jgi:hypothetical protein
LYTAEINRRQPACLLLLIDQSYSMSERWGPDGQPKAEALARAVNRLIKNAVLQCSKGDGEIHDYFEVGVIGYGTDVNLALHGTNPSRPLLPIGELAATPRRIDNVLTKMPDGAGGIIEAPIAFPVWIDPVTGGPTPMVQALQAAEQVLGAWCGLHPRSFPPLVVNLTDGVSTDGDPSAAAAQVRAVRTDDGPALLFNVHLSATATREVAFPSSPESLPDEYASMLFAMSSQLPVAMAEAATTMGYDLKPEARGFLYNAQMTSVIEFLDIGTRAVTPSGLKQLTDGTDSAE